MPLDTKALAEKYGQVYLRLNTEDLALLQEALTRHAPEVGERLFEKLESDYGGEWRQAEIDAAERLYDTDDVDIDQNALRSHNGDDGFFVQAWVFVRYSEMLPAHPDYPHRPDDYEEPGVAELLADALGAGDAVSAATDKYGVTAVSVPGAKFLVEVDETDDDPAAAKDGRRLDPEKDKAPEKVTDHVTLLDLCLSILARSPHHRAKISNLTTDGDGKDCEAIFDHEDEGTLILKVR